jgi:translation initiation factor 4A
VVSPTRELSQQIAYVV